MDTKETSTKLLGAAEVWAGEAPQSWHQVNWRWVNDSVLSLRGEVFTSSRNGIVSKLREKQLEILSHPATLLFAIRSVTSKPATYTPGIDEETISTAEEKWKLFNQLKGLNLKDWSPPPVKRVYILKADKKRWRPLGIPTIKDRVIQFVVKTALEPEWEAKFEPSSYGFRPGRGRADALQRAWQILAASPKTQPNVSREWILVADVKGCFDNVSHSSIKQLVSDFPASFLIERWLEAGIMEEKVFADTYVGFPQGGPISPLLCNIALTGIEERVKNVGSPKPVFVRYADDFVVMTKTYQQAKDCKAIISEFLSSRGLEFKQTADRDIVHITEGFDFLGCTIKRVANYGFDPKLVIRKPVFDAEGNLTYLPFWDESTINNNKKSFVLCYPSDRNVENFKNRVKEIFQSHTGLGVSILIKRLNPILRGYANSVRTVNCTKIFRELDSYIFSLTRRYLRRRHSNKSKEWIDARYFAKLNQLGKLDNWVFTDPETDLFLLKLRYFEKRPHVLIKGDMCLDDPSEAASEYFGQRWNLTFKLKPIDLFTKFDQDLYESQFGSCPVCQMELENGEKLHRHHILEKSNGGRDTFGNLVMVHEQCHYSMHYSGKYDEWRSFLEKYKKNHPRPKDPQKKKTNNQNIDLSLLTEDNTLKSDQWVESNF